MEVLTDDPSINVKAALSGPVERFDARLHAPRTQPEEHLNRYANVDDLPLARNFHRRRDSTELATRITDHYERAGLPRFYVVTVFNETLPSDFYVGGRAAKPTAFASSSTTSPGAAVVVEERQQTRPVDQAHHAAPHREVRGRVLGISTPTRPARNPG